MHTTHATGLALLLLLGTAQANAADLYLRCEAKGPTGIPDKHLYRITDGALYSYDTENGVWSGNYCDVSPSACSFGERAYVYTERMSGGLTLTIRIDRLSGALRIANRYDNGEVYAQTGYCEKTDAPSAPAQRKF